MSRLIDVAKALAGHISGKVDEAEVSYAPQARLGDIDKTTKAIIMPTGTDREMGRGCTHLTYHYEIGIMRWLSTDETPDTYIQLAEDIASDLLGEDLDIGVNIQDVQTTICDTDLINRRRQFVCVLQVTVMDGIMEIWK